jgi:hypothetical protein
VTLWLLKLVLAPALVVSASLAGRRWGTSVSGLLVGLPVVAGPVLLVTAVQHGAGFGAHAARASLLGLVSLCVFLVVFGFLAHLRVLVALLVAWSACVVTDAALAQLAAPPACVGWLVAVAAAGLSYAALRRLSHRLTATPTGRVWWDLPARALVTAALVATLTGLSADLGARVTGVLAPFPVASSVVVAFTLARQGRSDTLRVLAGVLRGIPAFATFCALAAALLGPLGTPGAFLLATVGALVVQLAVSRFEFVRRSR